MRILVTSQKGGVAKTTTAIHLAAYLAKSEPTVLVDADPARGCLTYSEAGNLDFPVTEIGKGSLKNYKNIVIDTRGQPTRNTLEEEADLADLVIVPTTPGTLSLASLPAFLNKLEGYDVRVLVTMAPPAPSPAAENAMAWLKERDIFFLPKPIRRYAAFEKAAVAGKIVRDIYDRNALRAWEDYQVLGRTVRRMLK